MRGIKINISILFLALAFSASGQQLTQYTLSTFNYFAINPAVAGSKDCLDLRLGFRTQWRGFPEGGPQTGFVNAHGKLATSRTGVIHGAGAQIVSDKAGPLGYTKIQASYALNLKMNKRSKLAMGVSAGFQQSRFDISGLISKIPAAEDPLLAQSDALFILPIIDFGMIYYSQNKFVGLTIKNVSEQPMRKSATKGIGDEAVLKRHIYISGGTSIEIGERLYFKPSVHARKTAASPLAIDANLVVDYNDAFAIGIVGRNQSGFSALVRISAFDYVSVAYAYDYTVSKMRYGSQNSHEIVLGIQACPKVPRSDIPCAAYY